MSLMIPTQRGIEIESEQDLLPKNSGFSMPDWISPLIKVSFYLHFFRGEISLPNKLLKEIFDETRLDEEHMDSIFVIKKIPDDTKYNRDWVR